jgi:hypothetical protein
MLKSSEQGAIEFPCLLLEVANMRVPLHSDFDRLPDFLFLLVLCAGKSAFDPKRSYTGGLDAWGSLTAAARVDILTA